MPPTVGSEIEDLLWIVGQSQDWFAGPFALSEDVLTAAEGPRPAYGPMSHLVLQLLERATHLARDDIRLLAELSGPLGRAAGYPEALLAMRRAADVSERANAARLAGSRAEWIVVQRAEALGAGDADTTCWEITARAASWTLGDAARGLVVADVLDKLQLQTLTRAWKAISQREGGERIGEAAMRLEPWRPVGQRRTRGSAAKMAAAEAAR